MHFCLSAQTTCLHLCFVCCGVPVRLCCRNVHQHLLFFLFFKDLFEWINLFLLSHGRAAVRLPPLSHVQASHIVWEQSFQIVKIKEARDWVPVHLETLASGWNNSYYHHSSSSWTRHEVVITFYLYGTHSTQFCECCNSVWPYSRS